MHTNRNGSSLCKDAVLRYDPENDPIRCMVPCVDGVTRVLKCITTAIDLSCDTDPCITLEAEHHALCG